MEIKSILLKHDFRFKKSLGQNFISDDGLLKAIVRDSEVGGTDTVIEVGTGAGTLTAALAEVCRKVYSFDVDASLAPVLADTLAGIDNVEVNYKDVLKLSDAELIALVGDKPLKVVANLPYYITTPLIMRFIESDLPVESITVMVQKEVADRLIAKANTKDYASITLAVAMWGDACVTRGVSRKLFHPMPNVDSAVVTIKRVKDKYPIEIKKTLSRLIKAGFAMRRKTLVNNLMAAFGLTREDASGVLRELGYNEMIRGEVLTLEDYIKISTRLK